MVRRLLLTSVGGIFQSSAGLSRMKKWRKTKFTLCFSWDIHLLLHLDSAPTDFWVFGLRSELIPLVLMVLRPSGLDWNSTTSFQGLQIAGSMSRGFTASVIIEQISRMRSISIYLCLSICTYNLFFYHLLLVLCL